MTSTRNWAFEMASAAAAIARGERLPSQSARLRAAKMAAAITMAYLRSCLRCSSMEVLRRGREISRRKGI